MEPIKPESVTVDRGLEARWIEQINDALSEPWGEDEVRRHIDLQGKFSGQSEVLSWVADRYTEAGWVVRAPVTPFRAADKYCGIEFTRPAQ